MASIKIDPEELEGYISSIQTDYALTFNVNPMTELELSGAGKVEDELVNYNAISNLLLDSLSNMYISMEAFLTCIKDGTLTADAYGAKQIEAAAAKQK